MDITVGSYKFDMTSIPYVKNTAKARLVEGKNVNSNSKVIVKIYPLEEGKISSSFVRESKALKRLEKESSVCKILHVETLEKENISVIIMEKYDSDLFYYAFERSETHLKESEVKSIFKKICKAVQKIHTLGIAHLDLKPENILIDHQSKKIYICDFDHCFNSNSNLRRRGETGSLIKLASPRGTIQYSAPEIQRKNNYCDPFAADVYSLGCVLFVLLTGCFPLFTNAGRLYVTDDIDISRGAESFINFAMNNSPAFRPSISELLRHPYLSKSNRPLRVLSCIKDFKNNKKII